jgi:GxxExxY protein
MKATLERNDLLHPELSYKIIGCAFNVFKQLGSGHLEKIYQKALAIAFTKSNISFVEQLKKHVFFEGENLGYGKSDFLVENKIIVELKRGSYFNPDDFDQVKKYLASNKLQLGILIRFTPDKVLYKRVVHIQTQEAEKH